MAHQSSLRVRRNFAHRVRAVSSSIVARVWNQLSQSNGLRSCQMFSRLIPARPMFNELWFFFIMEHFEFYYFMSVECICDFQALILDILFSGKVIVRYWLDERHHLS